MQDTHTGEDDAREPLSPAAQGIDGALLFAVAMITARALCVASVHGLVRLSDHTAQDAMLNCD